MARRLERLPGDDSSLLHFLHNRAVHLGLRLVVELTRTFHGGSILHLFQLGRCLGMLTSLYLTLGRLLLLARARIY